MTLGELQTSLTFSTDLAAIKSNVKVIKAFLDERNAEVKAGRALLQAVYEMCPHKNQTTYSDPRDWGGTCHDCGKTW